MSIPSKLHHLLKTSKTQFTARINEAVIAEDSSQEKLIRVVRPVS
ncbi:hypothetical protein N0Y54_09000 [Nostoc punctiforme UO1]